MSIKNPTLAHFRHFRHFSSLFTLSHLYICRDASTNQLLFMQNKPNVKVAQINVNSYMKSIYEILDTWLSGKNKPNSNPILVDSCWSLLRTEFTPHGVYPARSLPRTEFAPHGVYPALRCGDAGMRGRNDIFLPNGDFPLNIVPVITEASYCYCYRFVGWRMAFSG